MKNNIKQFLWFLDVNRRQFLRVDLIRFLICYIRFIYFYKIKRYFKTLYGIDHVSSDIPGKQNEKLSSTEYNANYRYLTQLKELYHQFAGHRSQRLVGSMMVCFSGTEGIRNKKCLSIGPRTEAELFSFVSFGAKLKDVKSIDLQTYSPRIIPGDINDMPYEDNSFDCIVAGWILPYVSDRKKAIAEMIRVAKDGAIIAFSHSWYPENDSISNGDFASGKAVKHNEQLLTFFQDCRVSIVVNYDQSILCPLERGDLIVVVKISKDIQDAN